MYQCFLADLRRLLKPLLNQMGIHFSSSGFHFKQGGPMEQDEAWHSCSTKRMIESPIVIGFLPPAHLVAKSTRQISVDQYLCVHLIAVSEMALER